MNLVKDYYTATEMGEIAFNRYGIYKSLPSAIAAVCLVINRIGLEDAFNPEKKQNRKFTKSDTLKVFEYLDMMIGYQEPEHLLPDSSITFGEDEVATEEVHVTPDFFEGWVVPSKSRGDGTSEICITKNKSGDDFRLVITMSKNAYKAIFGAEKRVTVNVSKKNHYLFIIPGEIAGVGGSWAITSTGHKYKFAVALTKKNSHTLLRFVGHYNVEELVTTGLPLPSGGTAKAWGFVPKNEGQVTL